MAVGTSRSECREGEGRVSNGTPHLNPLPQVTRKFGYFLIGIYYFSPDFRKLVTRVKFAKQVLNMVWNDFFGRIFLAIDNYYTGPDRPNYFYKLFYTYTSFSLDISTNS